MAKAKVDFGMDEELKSSMKEILVAPFYSKSNMVYLNKSTY